MNKDKNKKKKMAERFLAHALEIIYLLTGEEYTLVKKSSPHNCIHQLTGEFQIPIKCDDVAIYFSMEEWEYIKGHKEHYKDVMMEDHQTLRDMETPKNEHSGLDGTNLNTAIISEEGAIESEDKSVLQVGTCLDLSTGVRDALLDTPVINQEGNHVSEEVSVSQVETCSDVCTDPMDSPEALAMTSSPASQSSPHQSLDEVDYRGVFCHGSLKVEDTDTYVGSRDVLENSYTAVSSSSQIVEVNASLSEIRSEGEGTEINSAKELTFCESENLMSYSMAYQYEQHSQSPNESFGNYCNNVPYTTMSFKKFQPATSGKTSSRIIVCEDNLSSYTEENPINIGDNNYFKFNFMDAPLRVQTDNKLYVCQDCEKCFKKKSNFLAHRRTHTGEKPHVCQSCGKGFSQKCNLITHQRIHTGEKSYVCPQCKKGFTQRATLTKHQRTHTGEKPYICQKCGKGFNQKSFLLAHQITHAEGKS